MGELFPYSNILAGSLVLIVGFGIHWLNQVANLLHWELMPKQGLVINIPVNTKKIERFISISDITIGWLYGIIGVGLYLGTSWGYTLAWIPGIMLTVEGISYWIMTNPKHATTKYFSYFTRMEWSALNFFTGILIILVAWHAL